MRVLLALTYYRPYTSGLTIYAERLAIGLAARGHHVTVLTSQYDPSLPRTESLNGVHVVRVPVAARVSKGVIMPTFGIEATKLALSHDVMSLHLPQFDAPGLATRGWLLGKPVVLTYHCDLQLPPGWFNRVVDRVVQFQNEMAGRLATRIVAYTDDFATHSPYLSRFKSKVTVIPPPVEVMASSDDDVAAFRQRYNLTGPVIGMAARLAAEKGVEVLLGALPAIVAQHPDARVLFAGPFEQVLGEEAYARRLAPLFEQYKQHWTFLGTLNQRELATFFRACDVITVPSLNSTESFGLVQVEAMLLGTPSVASNLPGVRQPVIQTGMGLVVPIGDAPALGDALLRILADPSHYHRTRAEVEARFSTPLTIDAYERLFAHLSARN
ncbi:MAG: glycosyltransferase family 4 protein [Roseiflexaceae bacterium]|jgi:glycosyltransferase involved in cell wall biosynthesis|nr:glycosyltransferase family 4 protein [Chloroflexaceae bacterium]